MPGHRSSSLQCRWSELVGDARRTPTRSQSASWLATAALSHGPSRWPRTSSPGARRVLEILYPHAGKARTLGITGPPGVGKSSLIAALCTLLRARDQTIGVISVDPSSHITQGALLGDRIRLVEHFLDSGVYIRSMGTRGHLGGVAEATLLAGVIVDASGRDVLLYETVGVGQSEVEVAGLADTVALVLMPGSGDSIQALKAGVMEIPDVIVVNKADHPAIERTRAELAQVLSLADPDRRPIVVETVATAPSGIEELWSAVEAHQRSLAERDLAARRKAQLRSELLALAAARSARRLGEVLDGSPDLAGLVDALAERRIDPLAAVQQLLERA